MEAIGRLAGGVAHDFNNLLTAILGYSDLLLAELPVGGDGPRQHVGEIRHAGERAAALTQQLLAFSRRQVVSPRVIDLNEVVLSLGKMIARLIGESIHFETRLSPGQMRVLCDRGQLEQVVLNVMVNARDAMPAGGSLTLQTRSRQVGEGERRQGSGLPAGSYVSLLIRDTGHGMDEATRQRIFEPFFTTKPVGVGTGLGMATAYGIVRQAGGEILVDSAPGRGTTVTILLPLVTERLSEEVDERAENELPGGCEGVLVVEDEAAVRNLMVGVLRAQGYRVVSAGDPEQVLRLTADELRAVDLVIADVVMPRMNGRELLERLRERRPGLPALFVSGYTDDTILLHGVSAAEVPFLGKPFTRSELLTKVRELLEASRPATAVA
jgi:CheY-like chemotaxis protein